QMDKSLNHVIWLQVLEETYLKFQWFEEAKKHIYVDRTEVMLSDIEEAIQSYMNGDNNTQRCRARCHGRIIIQKDLGDNSLVQVV
ncbi:4189_t:CDS:1, partial [Funneliformis mosseae]